MKSTKRLVAIVLMAIMMLGATFTAMAANGSMKELTDAEKLENLKIGVYFKVTVLDGNASIADITDKETLLKIYDRNEYVANKLTQDIQKNLKPEKKDTEVKVLARQYFDVQKSAGGEVTLSLGDVAKRNYKGHSVVVSHYNTTTQKWEQMMPLPEIDGEGRLKIKFDSYSPILISVLNISNEYLKPGSGYSGGGIHTSGADNKSPKMGE